MEKRTAASQALKRQKPGSFTAVNGNSAPTVQGRRPIPVHEFEAQYRYEKNVNNKTTSITEDCVREDTYEHAPDVSDSKPMYFRGQLVEVETRPTLNDSILSLYQANNAQTSLNLDGTSESRRKSKIIPLRPGRNKYGFHIFADASRNSDAMLISDSSDSDVTDSRDTAVRYARNKSRFSILVDPRDSEQIFTSGDDKSDGRKTTSSYFSRDDSVSMETSFTRAPIILNGNITVSAWATVNQSNSISSAQSSNPNHHCQSTQLSAAGESQEAYRGGPFVSAQSTRREFGRELDANVPSSAANMSAKQNLKIDKGTTNTAAERDVRDFLAKALKGSSGDMSTTPSTDETTSSPEHSSYESWETTASSDELLDYDDEESNDVSPVPTPTPTSSLTPQVTPNRKFPLRKLSPPSATKSSRFPTGPFFAKFPNTIPPDETIVSPQTLEAYTTRVPSPSETICTCRLLSSHPTLTLAQCSNPSCVFVWYHYNCLDKAGKLSARHGRLVCQHCKNATLLAEKDDVEALVRREVEWKVSGEEIVAAMSGSGGTMGVVDPYGLGSAVREQEKVERDEVKLKDDQGALGVLDFMGYKESRSGVLGEAYLEPARYAERVKRMVEEAGEFKEEEEYGYEYDNEEGYEYEYEGEYDGEEGEDDQDAVEEGDEEETDEEEAEEDMKVDE